MNKKVKSSLKNYGVLVETFNQQQCKQLIQKYSLHARSAQGFQQDINLYAMWGIIALDNKDFTPNKQDYKNLFSRITNHSKKLKNDLGLLEQYGLAPKKMLLMHNDNEKVFFAKLRELNLFLSNLEDSSNNAINKLEGLRKNKHSKKPIPMIIEQFIQFYELYSGKSAKENFSHNGNTDIYSGAFYNFIREILIQIDKTYPELEIKLANESALGQAIKKALKISAQKNRPNT